MTLCTTLLSHKLAFLHICCVLNKQIICYVRYYVINSVGCNALKRVTVITLLFSVMSSVRHYCSECSNHITVCKARSLLYIAIRTHHTQGAGAGAGDVDNGTVIGWCLARGIFHDHQLVSLHLQGEMG